MTKKCKVCSQLIPTGRIRLGYNVCVNCSEVEVYGMVNVIVHKTGNSVQPLPKSQADAINKHGDRKRFGTVLKGGSKTSHYSPKNTRFGCSTSFVGSKALYELVGTEAMKLYEGRGKSSAITYIDKAVRNCDINQRQANQLKLIFNTLN